MDAFFLVDLFVNFNTGFVTADGEVVMCPRRSVKNYLWTWFPIDFVSSISPVLDYFIWWAARGTIVMPGKGFNGLSGPPSTCDGGANGLAMARLLKIGRIFKIFKVLRIAKLVKMGNDSADSVSVSHVFRTSTLGRWRRRGLTPPRRRRRGRVVTASVPRRRHRRVHRRLPHEQRVEDGDEAH